MKPQPETAEDVQEDDAETWNGGWDKVLEMDLNVASNLISGEISEDGRWLAASDMYEAKLFSLHTDVRALMLLLTLQSTQLGSSGQGAGFCETRERFPCLNPFQHPQRVLGYEYRCPGVLLLARLLKTHPLYCPYFIRPHRRSHFGQAPVIETFRAPQVKGNSDRRPCGQVSEAAEAAKWYLDEWETHFRSRGCRNGGCGR
jgi:hypothetical protein